MTDTQKKRERGEAYAGHGYGTLRKHLFECARDHIEKSIVSGFFCEAIAVTESVISDRLESRLSYLTGNNAGFQTLGPLINHLRRVEEDDQMKLILAQISLWKEKRNRALHELVKVEKDKTMLTWNHRIYELSLDANDGYDLLKHLYHQVADLNPNHRDRVFPRPAHSLLASQKSLTHANKTISL